MKINLYIVTHKEIETKYFLERKIMLVGAANKNIPKGYCSDCDDKNDNISLKNKNFCELTGLYAIVKNDDSDIISLEHYRRIFVRTRFYLFRYAIYRKKDIEKIMQKYDIIMPKKCLFDNTIYDEYALAHYEDDLKKVRAIIKKDYSDYLNAFDEVMASHETYLLNMFIGKTEIIKDYAKWLFDILFKLEAAIDISDRDDYQKRVFGFLSERLFGVYLAKHQEIKIYHSWVQMIYKNPIYDQFIRIKNRIKNLFKKK